MEQPLKDKNEKANEEDEKIVLVEPKDEINLEEPVSMKYGSEAFENENEVDIVGEYVYDTKLQNDEIHNTFWKTIQDNFKDGVDKFYDGSTCNEKIIIFWGKCKFKSGFNRAYILDKKNWPKGIKSIKIEDAG